MLNITQLALNSNGVRESYSVKSGRDLSSEIKSAKNSGPLSQDERKIVVRAEAASHMMYK